MTALCKLAGRFRKPVNLEVVAIGSFFPPELRTNMPPLGPIQMIRPLESFFPVFVFAAGGIVIIV
jgi:hypothetical protein